MFVFASSVKAGRGDSEEEETGDAEEERRVPLALAIGPRRTKPRERQEGRRGQWARAGFTTRPLRTSMRSPGVYSLSSRWDAVPLA